MSDEDREALTQTMGRVMEKVQATWKPLTPEEEAEQDARHKQEQWDQDTQRLEIPRRFSRVSFQTAQRTPALLRVKTYCAEEFAAGCCLVLLGDTGVGKTTAAIAAIRHIGYGVYAYFPALCGALLDPQRRVDALFRVQTARFCVLDDIGTEYVKEGGLIDAFWDEIIWRREAEVLPTILTTNLTPEQLKVRFSDRIVDRLRGEWGRIYVVPGKSLR